MRFGTTKNTIGMAALGLFLMLGLQFALFLHQPHALMETAGVHYNHIDKSSDHKDTDEGDDTLCGLCFVGKSLGQLWFFAAVLVAAVSSAFLFDRPASKTFSLVKGFNAFQSQAPPEFI